jgi:hypothetical protein
MHNCDTLLQQGHCHSDMKVKSVMLKLESDLDSLYEREVSFSCMSFHMAQNVNLESKIVVFMDI